MINPYRLEQILLSSKHLGAGKKRAMIETGHRVSAKHTRVVKTTVLARRANIEALIQKRKDDYLAAVDVEDRAPSDKMTFLVDDVNRSCTKHFVKSFDSLREAVAYYRQMEHELGHFDQMYDGSGPQEVTIETADKLLEEFKQYLFGTTDEFDKLTTGLNMDKAPASKITEVGVAPEGGYKYAGRQSVSIVIPPDVDQNV